MTAIRMSVSVDVRFVRSAKRVVGMPRVPRSCGDFVKNLKMHSNWLLWCVNVRLLAKKCLAWNDTSSRNAPKSGI